MITNGMKNTYVYRKIRENIDDEMKRFCKDDATIPMIVSIIITVIFCFNGVKPLFNYVYEPQETFGWMFLAAVVVCAAIVLSLIIGFVIGELFNYLYALLYFSLKFKYEIYEDKNYDKMMKAYREHIDYVYKEFVHYAKDEYVNGERPALRYSRK